MTTTTRPRAAVPTTSSLRHRRSVWSQNTSYTGRAGVHSEVSNNAHAMSITSQRQLSSNLSTIQSIHRKELRSLSQHRRSLETSMLAYTEKMRKISTDRVMLAAAAAGGESPFDTASVGACSERSSISEVSDRKVGGPSSLERLLGLGSSSNTSNSSKAGGGSRFLPSEASKRRISRVSVDSGVDVTMGGYDNDLRKNSDTPLYKKLQKPVPDIKVSCEPSTGESSVEVTEKKPSASEPVTTPRGGPRQNRQRRPGTADKPNLLALQQTASQQAASSSSSSDSISSCDAASEASLAIKAFPEFTFSSCASSSSLFSETRSDDPSVVTPSSCADTDRSQLTSSRASARKRLSAAKTRSENYWRFRIPRTRHSISVASAASSSSSHKNSSRPTEASSSSLKSSGTIQKPGAKPEPVKKLFQRSFRYSNAVEDVIKSIDADSGNNYNKNETDSTAGSAVSRVSEIFPTLDLEDLRQDKRRMKKEDIHLITTVAEIQESHQSLSSDDTEDVSESCPDLDETVKRERSLSAPDIRGEGEEAMVIKPLLKKYDSVSNLTSVQPPRKTVHFRLPEEEQ